MLLWLWRCCGVVVLSSWLVVSEAHRGRGQSPRHGCITARVEYSISYATSEILATGAKYTISPSPLSFYSLLLFSFAFHISDHGCWLYNLRHRKIQSVWISKALDKQCRLPRWWTKSCKLVLVCNSLSSSARTRSYSEEHCWSCFISVILDLHCCHHGLVCSKSSFLFHR